MRAVVAAAALVGLAAPVLASPPLVPPEAAVVIAGTPVELGAALDAIGRLSAVHEMAAGLGRRAAESEIGWDPGDRDAWRARGFDPDGRIFIALSVGDGEARYQVLTSTARWTRKTGAGLPRAFWRLRLIADVADTRRADRAVRALAAGLVGVTVVIRSRERTLIADLIRPVFFGAGAPAPRGSRLAAAADPGPGTRPSPGVVRLARPGLRAWLRSAALIELGRAMQRELHVAGLLARPDLRGGGPWRPNPRCVELSALARGPLAGLELALAPRTGGLELAVTALAAPGHRLDQIFEVKAVATRAHRHRGLSGVLELGLGSLSGLRALSRPPLMRSFTDTLAHLRGCEWHYGWTARLFGWPQLIGLFADEIAALGPRGSAIVAGLSTASVGIARWHPDPLRAVAVLEGRLSGPGIAAAASLIDLVFGEGRGDGDSRRWGRHRVRPYLIDGGRGPALVGASLGGDRGAALARRAVAGAPGPARLLRLRIDLDAAGQVLRGWAPQLVLLGESERLEIDAGVSPGALEARIRLRR